MTTTPQYTIRVRDSSLNPQGAISAWTAGDLVLRMNDVGNWSLTVKADDPLRQYFTPGNGIIITRDRGDGTGAQTILSGPIWVFDRYGRDNYFILGGPTDDWWLKARSALPQGGRPYMEAALLTSPTRYYRLGEASGTVAADSSGNAQNGTYVASPTLGAAGLIGGDPGTGVTFDGASQYVTIPNTGFGTGATPFTLKAAVKPTNSTNVGDRIIVTVGNPGTVGQSFNIYQPAAGGWGASVWGSAATGGTSTGGTAYLIVGTYDGANMRLYVNGALVAGPTAATATFAAGQASIGAANTGSWGNFFPGEIQEVAILSGTALSAAQVTADYVAASATHGAYDTRTGLASTVIQAYVNANLVAATNIDRNLATLVLAADPAVGTTVTGNARWDNLLALCQQLASAGGDIGFKIIQTANGQLTFSCYAPVDKSANAKFSTDLANLFDYQYSLAGPLANSMEVLGGGAGAARTALCMRDATSITQWGLVEDTRDARDTSDTATMQQRGTADINASTALVNLALTPHDTATLQYGRDYNLGDIIAITIDGATITNKIRSVHIQLTAPGDQELVTPGIGNPSQGDVAQWFDATAIARQQAIAKVAVTLKKLSTAL